MTSANASYPGRQLRADLRSYLRGNRRRLLLCAGYFLAAATALTIAEYFVLGHGPAFWYAFGAIHALIVSLFIGMVGLMWIASSQPAIRYLRGTLGESNTNDVLKAARRSSIWGFVSSLDIQGGDVDHVVVTRSGGVLAIDSKWCNEITAAGADAMASSARNAAQRAQSIMRSENVGTLKRDTTARHRDSVQSYSVRPVVVVWGDSPVEPGRVWDGVEFVGGPDLGQWLRSLAGDDVDKPAAKDLLTRLTGFRDR